jgi:hypothetical protein
MMAFRGSRVASIKSFAKVLVSIPEPAPSVLTMLLVAMVGVREFEDSVQDSGKVLGTIWLLYQPRM